MIATAFSGIGYVLFGGAAVLTVPGLIYLLAYDKGRAEAVDVLQPQDVNDQAD